MTTPLTDRQEWEIEFDEQFCGIDVFRDKEGEYYATILPKDRHEYDEYGLVDIKSFIRKLLASHSSSLVERVREKVVKAKPLFILAGKTREKWQLSGYENCRDDVLSLLKEEGGETKL